VSGDTQAPASVALIADAGAVLALRGPNGAGDSTLVGILTRALAPDAGSARLAGCDVVHGATAARSAIGLRRRFVAIGSLANGLVDEAKSVVLPVRTKLANGLVDEAKSVVLPVRTKRTDPHRAKSKSGDSSETRGKR
jgi:ABC-type branched-subunit amino acid transport system ATPase component